MNITAPLDLADLYSAKGLVIVITGGGSGIGLAFTSALAQAGAARIYILGRRQEVLERAIASLPSTSTTVVPVGCDVTDPASIAKAVAQVEREVGYVDVLINNAGMLGPKHTDVHAADSVAELQRILLADWDGWADTFAVNAAAVVGVSAAFLGLLDRGNQRRGWEGGKVEEGRARRRDVGKAKEEGVEESDRRQSQIVTVASIAGFNKYITAGMAYAGSKAAAIHEAKGLAHLLAPWGIRSNVVDPGIYPSDMTAGSKEEYGVREIPAGRKGSFEDLAGVILYLVGKAGAYVNGNVQITDGGRLSVMPATF